MKKVYTKPLADIVEFELAEDIMNEVDITGSNPGAIGGDEDW